MVSQFESQSYDCREGDNAAFCLVHGAWHGAWCWDYLRPELEARGHPTIAPDLPIDDPEADFDDYAEVVTEAIANSGAKEVVLAGHSRAGNVIPRIPQLLAKRVGDVAISKLIYIAASIEEHTIGRPLVEEANVVPSKNSVLFMTGTQKIPGNKSLTTFDPLMARLVFYHDCSSKVADWAIGQLRPQKKSDKEPKLEQLPEIPSEYIVCAHDRVITTDRQIYTALNWFEIPYNRVRVFNSGHSPMLAKPQLLADQLARSAQLE